jgi:hypothetical protein
MKRSLFVFTLAVLSNLLITARPIQAQTETVQTKQVPPSQRTSANTETESALLLKARKGNEEAAFQLGKLYEKRSEYASALQW